MALELPIDPLLPTIVRAVADAKRVLLHAEPAAGKTTRVPAALLDAGVAGARDVVVLEPRRVAARSAAEFVARARGGRVGGDVGYRVRFEQRGSAATRLWFCTEGVFGRMLGDDPFLERVGVVVLDEFHERHLQGDLALAVVRRLQDTVRPDLMLVVMSATLDGDALARYLPGTSRIDVPGRTHPVTITYDPPARDARLEWHVARATERLLRDDPTGSVLVFLPGIGEIRRVARVLAESAPALRADVVVLHGDQPLEAQMQAIRAGAQRRVVLATNVAESALTVEGITAVVDSGLARSARFDPRHGVDTLRLANISRASADQRAGRAGRLGPGRCVRLWSAAEQAGRRAHEIPECRRVDLTRTLLELHAWGGERPEDLAWLDPLPPAMVTAGERLLRRLNALDDHDALTPLGRRILALPVAPRLARLALAADERQQGWTGALLAALAGERDVLLATRAGAQTAPARDYPAGPSDLLLRADLVAGVLDDVRSPDACRRLGLEPGAVRSVSRAVAQLTRLLRATPPTRPPDDTTLLRAILAAFPDRVARRRAPGSAQALMVGGVGLVLAPSSIVRDAEYFVALDVELGDRRGGVDALVRQASAIDPSWLTPVTTTNALVFDEARNRVVARTQRRYDDLVLDEHIDLDVDANAAGDILAAYVLGDPDRHVPLDDDAVGLLARLRFLTDAMPEAELPSPSTITTQAVTQACQGHHRLADVRRAVSVALVRAQLPHAVLARLDREAPAHFTLPSGRAADVRYEAGRPPIVAARIQELFGLRATPRLADGRVPLVIELLAPSHRPVQTTADLANFWRTTYADVRKELRGRYPKHDWPEDPATGIPSRRPGRRR